MKNTGIVTGICVFLILIIILSGCIFISKKSESDNDQKWGEEGDLSLTISLDKTSMRLDEEISVNVTLRNIGTTKLRVIDFMMLTLHLKDSNNTKPSWVGPIKDMDMPDNDDLITLSPGELFFKTRSINTHYWDLKPNKTYTVSAHYYISDYEDITVPYWKGDLWSNEEIFEVI